MSAIDESTAISSKSTAVSSDEPATTTPLAGLGHSFLDDLPELCLEWSGAEVPDAELVVGNEALAADLGLDAGELFSEWGVQVLSGALAPDGARPVALGYAGHQFGNYSPRLGDGRALLLGELETPAGSMVDIHLKGSGRTPFARGGDGRATLGPMLREYVIAEFLSTVGVPTTRSLAVVTTGEQVPRTAMEPGAVLTRAAASHIRVGTFEYALRLASQDTVGDDLVRRLADHAIQRHYPQLSDRGTAHTDDGASGGVYRAFLTAVVDAQAALVAKWMLIGFIHGVMNTDNMAVSGEGIDYGPCAFMDTYDPATVFSSIDHGGRYAFGNQPAVASWNLARLAETLLDEIARDEGIEADEAVGAATEIVTSYAGRFGGYLRSGMAAKVGLVDPPSVDPELFDDLLAVMHEDALDWTTTFRRLAGELRGDGPGDGPGDDAPSDAFGAWKVRWRAALAAEGRTPVAVADSMDSVNPLYIPRNHVVEEALAAANDGDLRPFHELVEVLSDPFTEREGRARYAEAAPEGFTAGFRTFCGT